MKFLVTPDTGLQRRQPSLHHCPICLYLSSQIFSAPKKLNNIHTGSGQNASHRVFFFTLALSRHQGRVRTEQVRICYIQIHSQPITIFSSGNFLSLTWFVY